MLWILVFVLCSTDAVTGDNSIIANVKSRIIGGQRSDIRSRPFMISLHDHLNNFICGGSILSPKWGMTALHCFAAPKPERHNYVVRAGSNYNNRGGTLHKVIRIHAYSTVTYPHWFTSEPIFLHDIALFEVLPYFRFSPTVRAIRLPNADRTPRKLYVSGWGSTELSINPHAGLLTVSVPYVPYNVCINVLYLYKLLVSKSKHLCYGSSGKDSCYGDSGGPLTDDFTVYGIVSFGYNCGQVPGVYTKVFRYRGWIKKLTKL